MEKWHAALPVESMLLQWQTAFSDSSQWLLFNIRSTKQTFLGVNQWMLGLFDQAAVVWCVDEWHFPSPSYLWALLSSCRIAHVVPPSFAWLWKDHSCYLIELIIWNHCLIFHCAGLYFWCKATQKSCTHTFVTGRWVAYKSGSLFNRSLLSLCLNYILEVTLRCSSCSCLSHSPTESCEASEVMLNIYLQANTGCYTH